MTILTETGIALHVLRVTPGGQVVELCVRRGDTVLHQGWVNLADANSREKFTRRASAASGAEFHSDDLLDLKPEHQQPQATTDHPTEAQGTASAPVSVPVSEPADNPDDSGAGDPTRAETAPVVSVATSGRECGPPPAPPPVPDGSPRDPGADVLEQIVPLVQPPRFLQAWDSEGRSLSFGCGDRQHGVEIRSSDRQLREWHDGPPVPARLMPDLVKQIRAGNVGDVDGRHLFTSVRGVFANYLHFDDPRILDLVALWTIGTYLYTVFSHYGYLFFHSVLPRSGKTRALEVIAHLAFEATDPLNAPTPPTIRETATEGRTLLLDTLERWREKNQESYAAAIELLDAGFRNGGVVSKMVRVGNNWERRTFPVYAPYALAGINRESLTETALDRCFAIEMHRKATTVKTRRYRHSRCEAECRPIRDDLYVWALQNVARVTSEYEHPDFEAFLELLNLNDRAADIWRALFALARVIGLDAEVLRGLETLSGELGGDLEAMEDAKKLSIVRALRQRPTNGKVAATTTELKQYLAAQRIDVNGLNLHELLSGLGFIQKSHRLFAGPRRAWDLADSKLAELETELSAPERRAVLTPL